jgi:hypothetical protein
MARHGTFYWNELMTRDVETARAFYERTLGWTFESMEMDEGGLYWVAMADGKPVCGLLDIAGPDYAGAPEMWFAYVAVDDVDARVAAAERAGAEIVRPPFDVPEVGRIAILRQPDGAHVGWMTPAGGTRSAPAAG